MAVISAIREARATIDVVMDGYSRLVNDNEPLLARAVTGGIRVRVLYPGADVPPVHHLGAPAVNPSNLVKSAIERIGCMSHATSLWPSGTCILIDNRRAFVSGRYNRREVFNEVLSELELGHVVAYLDKIWHPQQHVIYEDIFELALSSQSRAVAVVAEEVWSDVITRLAATPEAVYELSPRKFEELVAELLARERFDVTLTPRSRDGGRDILVKAKSEVGTHLYLVECKRYRRNRPVGVEIVRSVYGVLEQSRATGALIVTTSRFTRGAILESRELQHRMALKDYTAVHDWLRKHAGAA